MTEKLMSYNMFFSLTRRPSKDPHELRQFRNVHMERKGSLVFLIVVKSAFQDHFALIVSN